jgi:hypothetical protein
MNSSRLEELIRANAEEIRRLHTRVHETFRLRSRSHEHKLAWQRAAAEFRRRWDGLAFPGGYDTALERIAAGESNAVEAALCFLEVRPYFFRSGYMFKDILRKIRRALLDKEQALRLEKIVVAYDRYRVARRRLLSH